MSIAASLHILAALIWVGGMFFAHMVMRPVLVDQLEPPQRLPVFYGVFRRFFPWVWACVVTVLGSGYWMLFSTFGGMKGSPVYLHIMSGLGLLMAIIFTIIWLFPYRAMGRAVAEQQWPVAAGQLARIRLLITVNLGLGLIVSVVAVGGRWWV